MGIVNNSMIIGYVESICAHVRQKEVHSNIKIEIQGHIEELVYEYKNDGLSEEEAIKKAIKDMGEPSTIGMDLDKIYSQRPNWGVLLLTLLLSSFGLIAVYFIDLNANLFRAPKGIFAKSVIWMVVGILIATMLYYFDYRKIKNYSWHLFIGINGLLVYAIFFGDTVSGIIRLSFGPLKMSIDYIAPAILGIALCGIFSTYEFKTLKNYIVGLLLLIVPFFIMLYFLAMFAALFYSIIFITISIATKKKPLFFSIVLIGLFSNFLKMIVSATYRYNRLLVFLNPYKDPTGAGYIRTQMNNLINTAGLFGKGFSIDKFVPYDMHTCFILTYIIHCFGWLAGILLTMMIVIFIVKILNMKNVVKNSYGRLLIICISTILSVQFILNILMVLGYAPIMDINLPFISYGGTQFIVNMALVGILSSIYRRKELKEVLVTN